MTQVDVRPYQESDREAWDAFVDESRTPHVLFRRGYLSYHADRFEDASQVVRQSGRIVALLPATAHGEEVRSHGGLTFGGLLVDARPGAADVLVYLEAVVERLRGEGFHQLVYKAVPHIYHAVPFEEDLYALFRLGAVLARRDIAATVRPATPVPYTKSRRNAVAKAGRCGVVVVESRAFEAFMEIETAALVARHGVRPVHTGAELALLASRFPAAIRLFEARIAGELVGGVVVYETPTVAHAQYIGATDAGRAASAIDAVIDHLLSVTYPDHRFFDFGISTEDAGRTLNEGLAANKESFGARGIAYDHYLLSL